MKKLESIKISGADDVCYFVNQLKFNQELFTITGSNDFYTVFYWETPKIEDEGYNRHLDS